MKMLKILLIVILTFPILSYGQQNFTLSGNIRDALTGETLIGATVQVTGQSKGTISNSYGFYSLSLPANSYPVRVSYLGYEAFNLTVDLSGNRDLDIELIPVSLSLEEVIISSERSDRNLTQVQIGLEKLDLKTVESLPVFLGERDILKSIQLLPGIHNSSEGSTGFNVRGGSMGQNLILLDEAPVYSSSHLMGFFSVFNSDALNDVSIYKGGIPANFGGRASSVLDITMNNGNSRKFSATGGIGLVSSRLTLEGPVKKDKMSFIISGRRTYGDIIAKLLFPGDIIRDDTRFYFYDLNAKLNYSLNKKNRLFLSGYFGKDVLEIGKDIGTNWGNTTGTLRWNHLFSDRLFSNTSLIYSKFDYGFVFGQNSLRLRSGIEDISISEDFIWYLNPENTLKTGLDASIHQFLPGELKTAFSNVFGEIRKEKQAFEGDFYILNEQKIGERLTINYGFRYSMFFQLGPSWFYNYSTSNEVIDSIFFNKGEPAYPNSGLQPRISFNYLLNAKSSFKLSYNRMIQFLHLLSNTTAGSPTDVWLPSSNILKPVKVDHISAGYFRNFLNNMLETSFEVYYKNMQNNADYEDGADILFNEHVESQVLSGKGRSYGMEVYLKKKYGTYSGWISYSLSRSENKIEGINGFKWYPVRYDKTHDLSFVNIFKINKRLSISAIWTYATGNAVSFPDGKYFIDELPVPYYTERNRYRMPAYHRLDISLGLKAKETRKFRSEWDFSVYNAYNRYNAYMITFRESSTITGTTEAVKLSLFGIVPAISYNFKF